MDAPAYRWVCLNCSQVNPPGRNDCVKCRLPCQLSASEIAQGRTDLVEHREGAARIGMLIFSVVARSACTLAGLFVLFATAFVGTTVSLSSAPALLGLAASTIPVSSGIWRFRGTEVILAMVVVALLCQVLDVAFYCWAFDVSARDYWWPFVIISTAPIGSLGLYASIVRARSRKGPSRTVRA